MRTRLCAVAAAAILTLAGCAHDPASGAAAGARSAAPTESSTALAVPGTGRDLPADDPAQARPTASACSAGGWDCTQQQRFDAVAAYVRQRPGRMGVVVRDRQTDAVFRTGATADPMWTASTIKVAIAATLLERDRAGKIDLSAADRRAMSDMLRNSSNDATDTLWNRYDGPRMLDRFRTGYGMSALSVVPGQDTYWRNLRCTAEDLGNLMAYVLDDRLHPDDRAYLVNALRGVADNQHWGVWAAGPALRPGNKDGWAVKPDPEGEHWVAHTAGFAGPAERYVVVVMYSLPPNATLDAGVQAVSDASALVFGSETPADVTTPG
jgi:post-segregation antitoxin (ccd killing protein)